MQASPSYVYGYARVSTTDQNPALQIEALEKHGCQVIVEERASGGTMRRPELADLLKSMRKGDTLVVWKLDRLGRTVAGIIEVMAYLEERGIEFVSITDQVDTSTPMGRAIFHIMAAMAQLERDLISERTAAGMAAARARALQEGRPWGRQHSIADNPKRLAVFEEMWRTGEVDRITVREIIDRLNKADPRAKKITSPETYRKWQREGFPGAILKDPDIQEDMPKETPEGEK